MALRTHPTTPIDLTQEQSFESETGILHATPLDTYLTLHYWITTSSILPNFKQYIIEASCDTIYFTRFSSEAVWTRLYPENPISNRISV